MDLIGIIGLILGFVALIVGMFFKGIPLGMFLEPAALTIILGGTVACVMNSYTSKELRNLGFLFKLLFTATDKTGAVETVRFMSELAVVVRKEGILALEPKMADISDPFMRKGIQMIIDGTKGEFIMEVLSAEIYEMEERHGDNAGIFTAAGTYAPTLAVLGAVLGLIAAMAYIDDTQLMSQAIASAFIATILGIFTGYVLWNPFATRLKQKSKYEVREKRLIVEGILSIQNGESPQILVDRLKAMLPHSLQKLLEEGEGRGDDERKGAA